MSAYKDVYGILDLLAVQYKPKDVDEDGSIFEFSFWKHPSKKNKSIDQIPISNETNFSEDYVLDDLYDYIYEKICEQTFSAKL